MISRCKHAGLLRALEGLAWSAELLPNVTTILARLDEVDTGKKWLNRPVASLREVLLTWYPQTTAGVEKRIAVLKSLAERMPAVAWKLLFAMLPQVHSTADLTYRPVWRDWTSAWQEGASGADYWKQVNAAAELVVRLVGTDPTRWCGVLDELQSIPEPYRHQLIERLCGFPVDEINAEQRRSLAEYLRKIIRRHRDFADAKWALPSESVDGLEQALSNLLPAELCERHAWLFVPWIDLEGFRGDHEGMQAEIDRLRMEALREIIDQSGMDGVLRIAGIVESPGQVGATLAEFKQIGDDKVLPGLLRDADPKRQSLAQGYTWHRISHDGWGWVRTLSLDEWDTRDAAVFLAHGGLKPEAWNFAEALGLNVFREYWKAVPPRGGIHFDQNELEFACQNLMEANRSESAIAILSCITYREAIVAPSIVMDVLTSCLEWSRSEERGLCDETLRTIQDLFGWLQNEIEFKNDEPTRRLARLEWEYLSLLDGFNSLPKTLIHYLSDDPAFFAELIALVFRSKSEAESDIELPERQRRIARYGYRLLRNWKRVPGTRSDGSVDEDQLTKWIESARSLCRESDHLEVADSRIGEMLASWPQPEDDDILWPCEAIRHAIEEADSDDLNHGFQIGALNTRGVTARSPFDGGDLEREEAAKYRRWAELCEVDCPRTADTLRNVAKSYEFDAQREDTLAVERAHERF